MTTQRFLLGLGLIGAALLTGCASTGPKRADEAGMSMKSLTSELDRESRQVDAVLGALDDVVAARNVNLRPPYERFVAEVTRSEEVAKEVGKTAQTMRAKADEHFEAWVKETQTITDPKLREAAETRRGEAKKTFATVTEGMDRTRQAYDPFISTLRDLRTALGNDLTARGVDAAAPTIQNAKVQGTALKAEIRKVQDAITKVHEELTSPKTP